MAQTRVFALPRDADLRVFGSTDGADKSVCATT